MQANAKVIRHTRYLFMEFLLIKGTSNTIHATMYFVTVCKVVATELEAKLVETGKTRDILEIGYSVDDVSPKKKKEYKKS